MNGIQNDEKMNKVETERRIERKKIGRKRKKGKI